MMGRVCGAVAGAMGQARGAWNPLFGGSPVERAGYAAQFAKDSPLVVVIYGRLNYAPYAAGVGAAGAGAYMALR